MKRLLAIGQVATRLGRSVDFVRHLTDEGQLKAEPRGKGKYRHYTDAAVVAYEAKEQRHRPRPQARPRPKPPGPPPMPWRRVMPAVDPGLYPNDDVPWEERFEPEPPTPPPPRAPSALEHVYLDTLIAGGMLHAPWGLPEEWRGKLRTLSSTSLSNGSRWQAASRARLPRFDTTSTPFSPRIMTPGGRRKNDSAPARRPPGRPRIGGRPSSAMAINSWTTSSRPGRGSAPANMRRGLPTSFLPTRPAP